MKFGIRINGGNDIEVIKADSVSEAFTFLEKEFKMHGLELNCGTYEVFMIIERGSE